jgi:hypothetical protein
MLKPNYTLNLRQLLKIAHELKRYLWKKLKQKKTQNVSKTTSEKTSWFFSTKNRDNCCSNRYSYDNYPSTNWEKYNRGCVAGWRL